MRKTLLLLTALAAPTVASAQAVTDIVFSQYYEGASNDKYFVITNKGAGTVNFTTTPLYVHLLANANADAPSTSTSTNVFALTGTMASGTSRVYKNSSAVNPSYAASAGTTSSAANYNGDDMLLLSTASVSTAGSGWASRTDVLGDGTSWGQDKAFYRNTTTAPETTFDIGDWVERTLAQVAGATSGDPDYLGTPTVGNLPVELVSFTAVASGHDAVVRWTTASETNNASFAIEALRGSAWTELATVSGRGTTSERADYETRVSGLGSGRHTLRLVQRDLDGTATVAGTVEVAIGSEALTAEVRGTQVRFASPVAQALTVEAFDVLGRRVATLFAGSVEPGSVESVELWGVASGVYVVRVSGRTGAATTTAVVR